MSSDKKFYTRVLTKDDLNLVSDLEEIAFKAQKDPWGTQAIQESFEDSYVLLGLFHYQKVIGFSVIFNTKLKLNKSIAEKLYIGVVSDTERFLHDYTTTKTFDFSTTLSASVALTINLL